MSCYTTIRQPGKERSQGLIFTSPGEREEDILPPLPYTKQGDRASTAIKEVVDHSAMCQECSEETGAGFRHGATLFAISTPFP